MLEKEAIIISELSDKEGFPKLKEKSQKDDFSYIIMSYLGPNLETIKRKN